MSRTTSPIRRSGWLYSVLSILVMTAQLVVAFAPLAESRDRRMESHVESGGAQTHRAHDDATCAACQARSIHGTAPRVAVPVLVDASPPVAIVRRGRPQRHRRITLPLQSARTSLGDLSR